jgi:hypothetical protein
LRLQNVTALAGITAKLGGAVNTVALDDALLIGAVSIDTGAGADLVNIERDSGFGTISRIFGPLKVLTGAGDDAVNIGATAAVEFHVPAASTLIDGGAGADALTSGSLVDGALNLFTPTVKNIETIV